MKYLEKRKTPDKGRRRQSEARYSNEELEGRCGEYFARCEEDGRKSTRPGLMLALGLTEERFSAWLCNEEGRYPEESEVLQRAMLRMRDELEQRSDTKSVFLLKQRCYGGYTDRPGEETGREVKIAVTFGGSAEKPGAGA